MTAPLESLLREARRDVKCVLEAMENGADQHTIEVQRDLLARIDAALETGGWISVEDRLPDHKVTVLCAAHRVCKGVYSYDGDRSYGHWIVDDPHPDNSNVTHWQPLPSLPKEKP